MFEVCYGIRENLKSWRFLMGLKSLCCFCFLLVFFVCLYFVHVYFMFSFVCFFCDNGTIKTE